MMVQFFSLLFLLYRIVSTNEDNIDCFLVRPGDGEEFVYSPVNVNATLHCAVNNTNLAWEVGGLAFDSDVQRPQLNARGKFQSGPIIPSDGVTSSSVIVFGSRELNNNTRICCQTFVNELKEKCTTLIIYGRVKSIKAQKLLFLSYLDKPSPPTNLTVIVMNAGGFDLFNISWMATTMMGVNQNFTIVLDMHTFETTQLYFAYQHNTSDIKCSAYIIAQVNRAGESDPSTNVSIPSLPDIGPVTASLTHQVWKYDGEIRVNVSFQVSRN